MKAIRKLLVACAAPFSLTLGTPAHAGIPVIDVANLTQAIQQRVVHPAVHQHALDRGAELTAVAQARAHDVSRCAVQVGVCHDDGRGLTTEFQ